MGILRKHPMFFWGLSITVLFLGLGIFRMEFLDTLERKFYDVRMKLKGDPESAGEIVMVDIDDDSIEKLGRWPWPRSLLAKGIRRINTGDPKVIGLNIILSEPEESEGLRTLKELEKIFADTVLDRAGDKGPVFLEALNNAKTELDNDKKLADAISESGKVVLPVFFKGSALMSEGDTAEDKILADYSIRNVKSLKGFKCPRGREIILPIPAFLNVSKGVGHINLAYDMDGTARRERLLYEYHGLYIPAYTLSLAALYLNLPINKISAHLGSAIYLGSLEIPTTWLTELLVSFKGARGSFKSYSFFDVINDKVPASVFKKNLYW